MTTPDLLDAETLSPLLTTRALGRSVHWLEETGSTSDIAYQLAVQGAPHGLGVLADRQTRGRGRRGRAWISPAGLNLYMSLVLRPEVAPAHAPELTLVAAVAACEAVRAAGAAATIKWPNDLEVGGRKLAGILTEMHADAERVHFVILGIGVDLNMGAEDFPPELRDVATSLQLALGRRVDRARFCAGLLASLETWFDRHAADGFAPVRDRWTQLSSTLGAAVRVQLVDGVLEGEAVGIDGTGALLVRTAAGVVERVLAGDVQTLRPRR